MENDIYDIFEGIISDEENDFIDIIEVPRRNTPFKQRIVDINEWIDDEVLNRFRLSKGTVTRLLVYIDYQVSHVTNRNHASAPITQLLVALRFYATGSFLIVAGDFGGLHKSATCQVVEKVSEAIIELAPRFIMMPNSPEQMEQATTSMYQFAKFPNCIVAVDCTHVQIQSPGGKSAEQFRKRKGYFSLNVQTICDGRMRIRDIVCWWPGSAADITIFNNSRVKADYEQGFYGDTFLVGDKGYALTKYMMIPLNQPQTPSEVLYNVQLIPN